jgi:hypothetical protein
VTLCVAGTDQDLNTESRLSSEHYDSCVTVSTPCKSPCRVADFLLHRIRDRAHHSTRSSPTLLNHKYRSTIVAMLHPGLQRASTVLAPRPSPQRRAPVAPA